MIEISHKDLAKYLLGVLILLAFLAILGIYMFFLSRISFGTDNTASLLLADERGNNEELNIRIDAIQKEIDATIARVKELENTKTTTPAVVRPTSNNTSQVVIPSTPAPKFLKISKFTASQSQVSSGSQINFAYSAENTERGASFRMLVQCPTSVTATYATNGANVCRRTIAEALPIDNSGNYPVNFTNSSSEPKVVIVVLLASDITGNEVIFRDSKVMTVTIMPSYNYISNTSNSGLSITLSATPNGGPVPTIVSFTAVLDELNSCAQSHWEFGDGINSENFAICPNAVFSTRSKTILENHQYNQPGTYTATLYAGDKRASKTVYISSPTVLYSNPSQYASVYTYNVPVQQQPVYNYIYTPQPPVYNYNYPSLPDVPTVPYNFRAVASNSNGITLNWSAPTYGNVVNYTIYRKGGASLPNPIPGSPTPCASNSTNVCYYTISGSLTGFTDNNVSAGGTYSYRILAGNGYGLSNLSESLTVTLAESNSPTVPRTFTATVNGGRIILNWTTPTVDNVSSYIVYRKGGSSLSIPVTTSPEACNSSTMNLCYFYLGGNTFSLTDSNLLPNTAYTYRIISTNPYGSSEYSDSLTVVSGQVEPPVSTPNLNPANRVDAITTTQLSWNSVGANYYKVYRSANRNDALPTNDDLISGCTTISTNPCFVQVSGDSRLYALQVVDNRYDTSRTYYYRVKAYGSLGASNWSNEVTATPNPVVTPPPAPDPVITAFTIDGQTSPTVNSGATLNLSYSGTNVSSYKLFLQCPSNVAIPDQSNGSNLCRVNSNDAVAISSNGAYQIAIFNTNNTSQAVTATLMAFRANGSLSNSITRTITVRAVTPTQTRTSPPQNLRIVANFTNITPTWDAPANGTPTSYLVVRKIGLSTPTQYFGLQNCNGNSIDPCSIATTNLNFVDINVSSGTSYTYVVLAQNAVGYSDPSNSAVGTLQAPIAPDPVITAFTIDGQTSPTVNSGATLNLSYSGTNVSSYKLFLQCPSNVAIPDQSNGSNLCRVNSNDAVAISSNGAYQMAIFNMNSGNQYVTATLMAFRANGSLSNTITRTIAVRPQPGF